jgi:hypothetical protein
MHTLQVPFRQELDISKPAAMADCSKGCWLGAGMGASSGLSRTWCTRLGAALQFGG